MLRGLFPRLFGQFKEGGIVHAKFTKSGGASPTYAFVSSTPGKSYAGLALAHNGGAGLARLTLTGGWRDVSILDARVMGQSALIATSFKVYHYGVNDGNGTLDLKFADSSATEAIANIADGDQVWITLYVNK